MPKNTKNFTAPVIGVLPQGMHADRGPSRERGLYCNVRGNSRAWAYRYTREGVADAISLGVWPDVSLAKAREKAAEWRAQIAKGDLPIKGNAIEPEPKAVQTLREATTAYYQHHEAEWAPRTATEWQQMMNLHILKALGDKPTHLVTTAEIVDVLKPIWTVIYPTAKRALESVQLVIEYAMDTTDDEALFEYGNPASRVMRRLKIVKWDPTPRASIDWREAPALYRDLCGIDKTPAYALRFLLLCCAPRAKEVIGARWDELGSVLFIPTWHVTGPRMKSSKPRYIPLSPAAMDLLDLIRREDTAFLFPGRSPHKPMGKTLMQALLRLDLQTRYSVHGMRATFRSWVTANAKSVQDHDAAEICLDHVIGTKVARVYDREDLLLQRRDLAIRWADYLLG